MSIGITQLILIIIIGIILFGNIPKIFKDVGAGIMAFKNTISKDPKKDSLPESRSEALNSEKDNRESASKKLSSGSENETIRETHEGDSYSDKPPKNQNRKS